jgi:hypothetical protein
LRPLIADLFESGLGVPRPAGDELAALRQIEVEAAEKLVDSWENDLLTRSPLFLAKARIQAFHRLLDPGSPLRRGRDDGFARRGHFSAACW